MKDSKLTYLTVDEEEEEDILEEGIRSSQAAKCSSSLEVEGEVGNGFSYM